VCLLATGAQQRGGERPAPRPVVTEARAVAPEPSAQRGQQLFASLHCFYCHRVGAKGGRAGPALDRGAVTSRTDGFLMEHFRRPAAVTPFSAMPVLSASEAELRSLILYIKSLAPGAAAPTIVLPPIAVAGGPASAATGKRLYGAAACGSCHAIGGKGAAVGPALDSEGNTARKLEWLVTLFRRPEDVAPGTIMPAIQGSDEQLRSLALYLLSLKARIRPTAALGRKVYAQRNCGYCHGADGKGTKVGPALARTTGPVRSDVWILEHFRDPAGVTPNTAMPRAAAADWEWQSLLKFLEKLMGGRIGRAVAAGGG
jgi:mono/diheme cytochrome c family protein